MVTRVVALCGGVGGARLLDGLAQCLSPEELTAIVNTGDDFEHWGLWVSPDLDTCMYTLAGLAPVERGWGRTVESFHCFEAMAELGGADWFRLGDRDLAVHLRRTELLRKGTRLTTVTRQLCGALGVKVPLLPMADQPRQTFIDTIDQGTLSFQDWLVLHRGAPRVAKVRFEGSLEPAAAALEALAAADLVVIAPSNPYVSVDPMLSLPVFRAALVAKPVVAVSPILGGQAVKGPLAAMIPALTGQPASAEACADHYGGLLDGFVVQTGDSAPEGLDRLETDILMRDRPDRGRLAREVLDFAGRLLG